MPIDITNPITVPAVTYDQWFWSEFHIVVQPITGKVSAYAHRIPMNSKTGELNTDQEHVDVIEDCNIEAQNNPEFAKAIQDVTPNILAAAVAWASVRKLL